MTTIENPIPKRRRVNHLRVIDTKLINPIELLEVLSELEWQNTALHDRINALEHRLSDIERDQ